MFGINEIWFLLGIPLLATVFLLFFYLKQTKWWELGIVWGVAILTIFVSQVIVERISVSDNEVWGFNGVKAVYDEPYQYWDTCSRTYPCGEDCYTDSKGNRSCSTRYCTEYYDCKQWGGNNASLIDQMGGKRHISPARYKKLEGSQWKNSQTIELNREKKMRIIVDGDRRVTTWPGTWETAEPIAEAHTYENRTQCTSTIRFQQVTEEDVLNYGLFTYPTFYGGYEVVTIQDQNGVYHRKADQFWRYLNGVYGPKRMLRMWVLIFRDQPRDVMFMQQGLWKNGNKNEFIFCIGADKDGNVQWGDVISWTEVEELKVEARDYMENMKTVYDDDLIALGQWAEKNMVRYVKPEFTEKFKHLAIQPSTTSMVVTAIIILLVTAGVCVFVVMNPWANAMDPDTFPRRPYRSPPAPRKKSRSTSTRRRTRR
jgi:hypothetical protein